MVWGDIVGDASEAYTDDAYVVAIADIAIADMCICDTGFTEVTGDSSENWADVN